MTGAASDRRDGAPASLLGVTVRSGRARREPAESGVAAPDSTAVPAGVPTGDAFGASHDAPPLPAALASGPRPDPADVPAAAAPRVPALLAQWRSWRNGSRLPDLAKAEGHLAALCPGGVLLAVAGERVEVARRLAGAAPEADLAALDWMRGLARQAAREGLPQHEVDPEANLGLLALPFALDESDAARPRQGEAGAVLCRLYRLERPAELARGGFLSGVFRRFAGA